MFRLVLHALGARRAQALTLFALTALAALGAGAAPWFLGWGRDAVAQANIASAPTTDRLVVGQGTVRVDPGAGNPMDVLRQSLAENLAVPGAQSEVGARVNVTVGPPDMDLSVFSNGDTGIAIYLASHDNVCAHLQFIAGACPAAGEVAVPRDTAAALHVSAGDPVAITSVRFKHGALLRVSGVYDIVDPFSSYWSGTALLPGSSDGTVVQRNPLFTTDQTLLDLGPDSVQVDAHVLLPAGAFTDPGTDLGSALAASRSELSRAGIDLTTRATDLLNRVARDQDLVLLGVLVAAAQLVLVSWVGLFLAVRHTSEERRADIGLLKLRGTASSRIWAYVALSSGVPMFVGAVLGALLGYVAAALVAASLGGMRLPGGPLALAHTVVTDPMQSLWVSAVAAAVAGFGGLVAAVVAEWGTLRAPVVDLLRRVPSRQRGLRADIAELAVVVLAVAGVYEAHVEAGSTETASTLVLVTPLLVGLAVALLVGRTLPLLAATIGQRALRSGRVGATLAAMHLARRQGTQRVFAVLAVAAAVFTMTAIAWRGASTGWEQRAEQELGADRVLTVDAPNASALLSAVRAVDPSGRYAMAVATTSTYRPEDRVLAVDASRLAAVGRLPAGMPSPAELAAMIRPSALRSAALVDGILTVDVDATGPASLVVHLAAADGKAMSADLSVGSGRQKMNANIEGCGGEEAGCRLVSFEVRPAEQNSRAARVPVTVDIFDVSQPGGSVFGSDALGDITRWRTTFTSSAQPPELGAHDGQLSITVPPAGSGPSTADNRVLPLAAPAPLPIVLAGKAPQADGGADAHISALGGSYVPFVVKGTVPALPDLGDGSLVDLDYLLHSNDAGVETADLSIWVTADAPKNLVAALKEHGVNVLSDTSAQGRVNALAAFGPGLAVRFQLFAAIIILLLAAGVAVVGSTVDSSARLAELVALRGQGMPARAARGVGYAGSAVLAGLAVVVGVLSALLGHGLVGAGMPIFSDNWQQLPRPSGLTPLTLLVAVGLVVLVLGIASLAGAARLVARVAARTSAGRGRGGGRHATVPSPPSAPTIPSARTGQPMATTSDRAETSGGEQ